MARNKLIADFFQWVIILTLSGMCLTLYLNGQSITKNYYLHKAKDKNISTINKIASDSVNFMHQDNPLTIVKYKLVYKGDTIYVNRKLHPLEDKIYDFTDEKGGIKYQIRVKARNVSWYKVNISINSDSLLLANK